MAAGTLPIPGIEYGPCIENCDHADCAATNRQAENRCRLCGNPIGYSTRFYVDPEGDDTEVLVHADCMEDRTPQPGGPKYPHIEVQLSGEDGNAHSVMGRTINALKLAGVSADERKAYGEEATSGDYDNLLRVTMGWVSVK